MSICKVIISVQKIFNIDGIHTIFNRDASTVGDFDLTCDSKPIVLSSSEEDHDFDVSTIFSESNEIMMVRMIREMYINTERIL